MIKHIIIADDDEYKRETVMEYLEEIFPNADVTEFSCINDILYYIARKHYDEIQKKPNEYLVVTDMIMPVADGEFLERDGGYQVLMEMNRRKMTSPAIIVSSDKVDDTIGKGEYEYYLGSVKEDSLVYTLPRHKNILANIIEAES